MEEYIVNILPDKLMTRQNKHEFVYDFLKIMDDDFMENYYDLILSDIAPNTTGHQSTDHLRIATMLFDIIELLEKVLVTEGSFITKIWKGSEEKEIINQLKKKFKFVSYFKPDSSRKDSAEIFIISRNFIS